MAIIRGAALTIAIISRGRNRVKEGFQRRIAPEEGLRYEMRVALLGIDFDKLAAEVMERCDALARCTDDVGRITRFFCSPAMRAAHQLTATWMESAGMATRLDAAGNLLGAYRSPGCDQSRRVVIGSHLDTVANAGRYDGILGVMMGIAVVEALRAAGTPLPWAIEVVAFSDEEGVRYGLPFIGSRAVVGMLDDALLALCDDGGVSMAEALRDFGADPQRAAEWELAPGAVVAYVEPHIEQGPLLELVAEPVGVVTAIAGQTRMTLTWTGAGGHAGTVPMAQRNDPLAAACRWTDYVYETAQRWKGLVATVGRFDVDPNVSNCIARCVQTSLDVRHADDAIRVKAVGEFTGVARRIADSYRVDVQAEVGHEHAAVAMDAALSERLAQAASSDGHEPQRLVSGAGHDAGVIAARAPAAMLFLRCPGGVSHDPRETVLVDDVAVGLRTLLRFIENLADG